jgi:hypothetical protein
VDNVPKEPNDLRAPFTQQELLDRVEKLLSSRLKLEPVAAF